MNNSRIRNADFSDLSEIVNIYNQSIPGRMATADTEPISAESRVEWFHSHKNNQRPLWVIETDGRVVGWLSLHDFYGRCAYKSTVEISIYIHNDFHGKGIGSSLINYMFENCKTYHIENILAFVFGHNTPSICLFKKFGFGSWGILPGVARMDNIKRDLIILGKKV